MKRRFFLVIMTLILVLTLGACSLEGKDVELGVSASFQHEMVEGTQQKVEIEVADSTVDLEELVVTWESSSPEIAEVTEEGLVKAKKPGKVTIEVTVVAGEASKELVLEITVVGVVYVIEYELDGGQNSELNPAGFGGSLLPVELHPATKLGYVFLGWEYEGQIVEVLEEARNYKLVAKWELEEYSISYDAAGGEYEGEATESYTIYDSVELPVPTKEGYEFLGWYAGEELVESIEAGSTGDLELVAKYEALEYAINYDLAGGAFEEDAEAQETYTIEEEVEFLVPVKEGHRFLGWYAGEELVEGIEKGSIGDVAVVAKWEAGYYIDFELAGGALDLYETLDDFLDAFFEEYVAVCQAEQSATITKDTFHSNSHPSIKTFFGDAERLAKYHWLIAYVDSELREYNAGKLSDSYVADTLTMLELMLKGDTAAISASGYGPNGRTLLRNFIHGMLNHNNGSASVYKPYTPDFSAEEQRKDAEAAEGAPFLQDFFKAGVELPVPTKEGHIFEGWYNEEDELVEAATEGGTLTAHWRDYYVIEFDLNGGEWAGLHNSFDELMDAFFEEYVAVCQAEQSATITKDTFHSNSHPSIKTFFGDAERLAKYHWLIAYVDSELREYNAGKLSVSYVADTLTMLELMLAGDTTAISAAGYGPNGRTLLRNFIHGMLNHNNGSASVYIPYTPDFSAEEQREEAYAAYFASVNPSKVKIGAELPKPVKGALKFLGWLDAEGKEVKVARADEKLVASWETTETKSAVEFDLVGGEFASDAEIPTEYIEGKGLETLPAPTKEGYVFLGWYLGEELVEGISAEQEGDVKLVAKWQELSTETILKVGPNEEYKTVADALLVAQDGAIIRIAAGTYEGFEITKSVTIEGANAGVNPNRETRGEESIFTSDILISANNVVIDGIYLTGKGRIVGNTMGVENIEVRNVCAIASTVNETSADSATAPLSFFSSVEGAEFKNLVFTGLRYAESSGRPMAFYGAQINGLEITDSYFTSKGGSYNDGIKISENGAFGTKGDIKIVGNFFENYTQYVIWFIEYSEGNYFIANNTIKDCGQASYHATRFDAYTGDPDAKLNIEFVYNTVNNSFEMFRMNESTPLLEENISIKVNYNKLIDCGSGLFIDNRSTHEIDGRYNWYNIAPVASNFLNKDVTGAKAVTWQPYYEKESDVPEYVDEENSIAIKYELDGGVNPSDAPKYYNKKLGITTLPTPNHAGREFIGWYYNGEKVESLEAGLEAKEIVLVAKWRDQGLYVGANEQYKTVEEALAAAQSGQKVILTAGTYSEDITINKAYITIQGEGDAILTGVVTVAAKGVTLSGLSFTGAAQVKAGQISDFRFVNNKVYDTVESANAWKEDNSYKYGFLLINSSSSDKLSQYITIANNTFENVSEVNLMLCYVENVSIEGNVFKNFDRDAVRFDGGTVGGNISITNNEFTQDTLGGYNGVFFRMYGDATAPVENTYISIKGNKFVNIGNADAGLYTGAIGARNYQEYGASFEISGNYFEKCYNYIRIRNNATVANHAAYVWACKVENNIFVGLPTEYYFASWNASGKESTDPIKAVFGANYYEDNDGKAITDLSAHQDKFKQVANIGTALEAKPELAKAEAYEIYRISYELNGGSTLESFVYGYDSLTTEVIALPTLTKANHNFLGWYINDEKVESIDPELGQDLVLVAKWEAYEGEIYELELDTNGHGNFPTRDAVSRDEIVAELYKDLWAWAQANGETRDYETWKAAWTADLVAGKDNKLYNNNLNNYPDETASTEYFLNSPGYYEKWTAFFAIFDEAVIGVNPAQSFFGMGSVYVGALRFGEFVTWGSTGQSRYTKYIPRMLKAVQINREIPTTYQGGQILELPSLTSPIGREFLGWYDNPEFTGSPVSSIVATDTGDKKFYAKWEEEIKPTVVNMEKPTRIKKYEVYQLVWTLGPENAQNKEVEFFSSNPEILSVTNFGGKLTAHKDGKATITMKVYGNREIDVVFEVEVFSPTHIEGGFESSSFVAVGETIELFGKVVGATDTIKWSSLDETIATVDQNGVVTGVKAGTVKIVAEAANDATVKLEYFVTVLEGEQDDIVEFILAQHNANIYTYYDMVVGGDYSVDIYSSISKLFYNHELYINTDYVDDGDNSGNLYKNANIEEQYGGLQFITFHYTGTMGKGADPDNIVKSMTSASSSVSIHFATGNMANGNYTDTQVSDVYQALSLEHGAWHAGDSNARYYSNSTLLDAEGKKRFMWIPTGVAYDGADLLTLEWSASDDFYFEINGKKTTIKLPDTYEYNSRKTKHIYNADGTISSSEGYGQTAFTGRTPESFFNDQGFVATVIDGYYYMCPTWWSYGQVYEGRICAVGGNMNSIGIESCVDVGSDLWYTWQTSAQLIAKLLDDNDLTIDRVKGHHFFDGKNCPQPMLENNLEIWWEFIDLIKAELELRQKYNGYKITMVSNNPDIVDNHGRVVEAPEFATAVSYTVTIEKDGQVVDTLTLGSIVPGIYEK